MAITAKTETLVAPETEDEFPGGVDPWEGFTPEERERGYRILAPEEGRVQFDRAARRMMGIGGDEFIRRWDAGEYDEIADKDGHRHIMDLAIQAGFAHR